MAASKRFRIPTLDEMEQGGVEKVPEPLIKRRKELSIPEDESPVTTVRNVPGSRDSSAAPNTNIVNRNNAVKPTPSVNRIQNPPQAKGLPAISKEQESSGVKDKLNQNTSDRTKETTNSNISKDASNSTDTGSAPTNGVDDEVAKGSSATVSKPGSSNSLIVNTRQRGNPILKSVRNIPWEYGNIVPDYVMGQSNCALYLSLRYHQLHPNYIHERLKLLGRSYDLRVMLVQVDVKEPHHLLKDLAKICLLADCTLILAFTPEEAGRYLETYKIFENKPPEAIMEKTEENFMAKFTDCLTRVKSVNKTDCTTLISHFGSLANIMEASEEDLSLCPGFGPQKAKRLHDIFHEPFLRSGPKATSDSSSTAIS